MGTLPAEAQSAFLRGFAKRRGNAGASCRDPLLLHRGGPLAPGDGRTCSQGLHSSAACRARWDAGDAARLGSPGGGPGPRLAARRARHRGPWRGCTRGRGDSSPARAGSGHWFPAVGTWCLLWVRFRGWSLFPYVAPRAPSNGNCLLGFTWCVAAPTWAPRASSGLVEGGSPNTPLHLQLQRRLGSRLKQYSCLCSF